MRRDMCLDRMSLFFLMMSCNHLGSRKMVKSMSRKRVVKFLEKWEAGSLRLN